MYQDCLVAGLLAVGVRLLGPVEIWAGSARVEVGPPRQRAVLAALAVDAGRVVAVEALVDRVWGPEPPQCWPPFLVSTWG
jgi:DNA-binding SARP family transcriptional activator